MINNSPYPPAPCVSYLQVGENIHSEGNPIINPCITIVIDKYDVELKR
jgi:hypothetical protein